MSSSVSRLPWWSQWRMTPTTATKVDLSKEHIPTIISFPHGSRTSFIQAGKQRNWFFVETAWSLVFLFPHLLYFCFVVFPPSIEHLREKEEMKLFGISRENKDSIWIRDGKQLVWFFLSLCSFYFSHLLLFLSHISSFPFWNWEPWIGS